MGTTRVLLTVGTLAGVGVAAGGATLPASAGSATAPHGTVAGSYHRVQTNPDTGRDYSAHGHGRTSLGSTAAGGHVQGPGNIAQGPCTARLVLTTSHGSLTVRVTSSKMFGSFAGCQSGFAFHWKAVAASGSYSTGGSGTGTLTLVKPSHAAESPPPFYVTFD